MNDLFKSFKNKIKLLMAKTTTLSYAKHNNLYLKISSLVYKYTLQYYCLLINKSKPVRYLEIGPGVSRIDNFETANVFLTDQTDYIADISKKLPFADDSFNLIYASHVLEHTTWYLLDAVFSELYRILKKGGTLEIWVPDGLKICKAFVDMEINGIDDYKQDGWYRLNPKCDPTVWVNGRIFSYGDGTGDLTHPNYHHSVFSERLLVQLLQENGFVDVSRMEHSECRGYDHGWINLGVKGKK